MKNFFTTRNICVIAIFTALVIVLSYLPIGLIPTPIGNIAPLLIAVVVLGCLTNSFGVAFYITTLFGVVSFIRAYTTPSSALSIALQNPLISIFPRAMISVSVHFVYIWTKKMFKNGKNNFVKKTLPLAFAGAAGSLTNAILLLSLAALFSGSATFQGSQPLIYTIPTLILIGTIPETFVCSVIVPPIAQIVNKVINKGEIAWF